MVPQVVRPGFRRGVGSCPCHFQKSKSRENDEISHTKKLIFSFSTSSTLDQALGCRRRRRRAVVHLIVHGVGERCCCPTTRASGCQSVQVERLVQHPRVWFVIRFLICTGEQYPNWIPSRHHSRYLRPASCPDTGGTIPQERCF